MEQARQGRVRSITAANRTLYPWIARRVTPELLLGAGCSLIQLNLAFSGLNGTWGEALGEAAVCSAVLRELCLDGCGLRGPLPELRLPALQELGLVGNALTGGLEPGGLEPPLCEHCSKRAQTGTSLRAPSCIRWGRRALQATRGSRGPCWWVPATRPTRSGVPGKLLSLACDRGHADVLRLLLEVGKPMTPAASAGLRLTGLRAGDVGGWQVDGEQGRRLLYRAIERGDLPCVLSSFGAPRHPCHRWSAEELAEDDATHPSSFREPFREPFRVADTLAWLRATRGATPLHHLEALSETRTRALLRAGADVHARLANDGASVLELAGRVAAEQPGHGAAQLVLQAAAPWSPTHKIIEVDWLVVSRLTSV